MTFCLKPCHTDCIDKVSLQCGSSDTFQDYISKRKLCYTGYIDMISPQEEFMDGALEHNSKRNYCFTNCIDAVFPKCETTHKIWILLSVKTLLHYL